MNKLQRELVTFIIAGSFNTLFGYGLFCLFIFMGLHHLLAITLSFCFGVFVSFQTIGRFVFRSHDPRLIFKFILLYLGLYFFNIFILSFLHRFSSNWYWNGALTTILAAALSFLINKCWVFKTASNKKAS